jgi:hypothetical protein
MAATGGALMLKDSWGEKAICVSKARVIVKEKNTEIYQP